MESGLEIVHSATHYCVTTSRFTLEWELVADRWHHRLMLAGAGAVCLISVEGTPEEAVPASPAFQDLWFERLSDEQCEFQMMGQAGQAIFSGAIRVSEPLGQLEFDLCSRRKKEGVDVCCRSTYELHPLVTPGVQTTEQVWEFPGLRFAGASTAEPAAIAPVVPTRFAGGRLVAGYCLETGCIPAAAERTIRWGYRVCAVREA